MLRLCVYGTMREGGALNGHLPIRFATRKDTFDLHGVKMYNLGGAPGCMLSDNEEDSIVAEVWEFDLSADGVKEVLKYLDRIEGVGSGLYRREEVDTPRGKAWMYFHNFRFDPPEEDRVRDWMEEVVRGGHQAKNKIISLG